MGCVEKGRAVLGVVSLETGVRGTACACECVCADLLRCVHACTRVYMSVHV